MLARRSERLNSTRANNRRHFTPKKQIHQAFPIPPVRLARVPFPRARHSAHHQPVSTCSPESDWIDWIVGGNFSTLNTNWFGPLFFIDFLALSKPIFPSKTAGFDVTFTFIRFLYSRSCLDQRPFTNSIPIYKRHIGLLFCHYKQPKSSLRGLSVECSLFRYTFRFCYRSSKWWLIVCPPVDAIAELHHPMHAAVDRRRNRDRSLVIRECICWVVDILLPWNEILPIWQWVLW